ncbi:MAG: TM1812 family CRISPR-associated protein [Monoglobaceae bacterium]
MKKVFITTVPEQEPGKLKAHIYQTEQADIKSERETEFPIFNVLENEHGEEHELIMIIVKQPGENFDYNYEILKKDIKDFEDRHGEKINTVLVERGIEETLDVYTDLFKKLAAAIPDNCNIYTDITYGTKPGYTVIFAAMTYALRLKENVDIDKVVYGKIFWREGKASIYEITRLFYFNYLIEDVAKLDCDEPQKAIDILFGI